ncbi:helix-turn-helix transcriptional regulator [Microbacterium luticocti]|uniref:helix-turn-helix transcriptional regulator n=1 Tax=Microbacterium luticocti TaxID=451764 RepID=UPI000427EFEA|nr:helix-turn-helix domain-containing protein [Microbacterium luticocti]
MGVISHNRAQALGLLGDPVRRRVYAAVAEATEPMGRDATASAAGVPRSTAAFHLDRLAAAGLLAVEYRRLSGRSGPGAGRPAKLYRAVAGELAGSIPERHYELAGELLARAAEQADADGIPVREAIAAQAHGLGAQIGADCASTEAALTACGYEPADDGCGGVLLQNCPFHALAARHTDLVCTANLALVQGMVAATGDRRTPQLSPREGHCCVQVRALPDPSAQAHNRAASGEHPTRTRSGSP